MKQLVRIALLTLFIVGPGREAAYPAGPTFMQVRNGYTSTEAVLLDRNGEVIHELRIDPKGRRLDWIELKDLSPALRTAVIQTEDRRFYQHGGVDWLALASATVHNLFSSQMRGASTITMQLTSILERRKSRAARRTWREKWRQIQRARDLERSWSKDQILEAYLNLVSFRGELQGVAAASQGLFGKEAHGLDDIESRILAVLVRSPNAALEKVASRACALARSSQGSSDCGTIGRKVREALARPLIIKPRIDLAPHVAANLLEPRLHDKERKNFSAVTTLDGKLQRFVIDVLREQLLALKMQNVKDGAVLVVENATGNILAYVGSSGELASARFVDGIRAPRQAGSTLKPFLYGLAFDGKVLTPASLLDDSPADIADERGVYRPRNYDDHFQGPVTARTALASSLNVPAVRTLGVIGAENFLRKLRELGFTTLNDDDGFYGPSLALGSADVSLWALVNAYRTLANGGRSSDIALTPIQKKAWRRVYSEEASFLISSILSDRESRSLTFGLEGPLATRFWTAVKTGTSKDMRDNWCVGYSRRYTVGVWVGNFTGEPMWNVSGMSGAAPIWLEVMNWLHKSMPSIPPDAPRNLIQHVIESSSVQTSRLEWFIRGTEPVSENKPARALQYRITYPAEGTILAVDPDIPEELQKIFFEAKPTDSRLVWILDGVVIGNSGAAVPWSPAAGNHTLSLVNGENRILDRIGFSVRGIRKKEKGSVMDPGGVIRLEMEGEVSETFR
jgi:penicillin-binding protein 1C